MAEQVEIPGTERPKIQACERAAKAYEKARDARMEATEDEVKQKGKLQAALHANEAELTERDKDGNPGYTYLDDDGVRKIAVLLRSEEDVKVSKYKMPKAADAEGAAE